VFRSPLSLITGEENHRTLELSSASGWKERRVPQFTEDNLRRIMINPFYAITVAPQLTAEHDPAMSEAEWVQANVSLIKGMGTRQWLGHLLGELEGKDDAPDERINPFRAANIDPLFAAEHMPLIEREMWVDVNSLQIRDMGTEEWLRRLLDVLNGDIVMAEEVGAAPPLGGSFAYGAPGKYRRQRGKQKRKKKRKK
jgi:hypothetical protein